MPRVYPPAIPRPPLRLMEGEDLRRFERALRENGFLPEAAAE